MPLLRFLWVALSYSYYIGLSLAVASLSFIGAPVLYLLFYSLGMVEVEDDPMILIEFGLWGALLLSLGALLSRLSTPPPLSKGSAILITVFVWLFVPIASAIPLSQALDISVVDAAFEAIAGWTTTGLTIMVGGESSLGGYVPSVDDLPETVKVWRSLIQWEGGVGIVVFTIAFLARPGISAAALYLAEGRYERLEASLKRSALKMAQVYMFFTGLGALLLTVSGMDVYHSLLHSMTAISTAGFSTWSDSIGRFKGDYWVYAASLAVSLWGAMSFADLDNLMHGRLRRLLASPEFRAQIVLIVLASALALAIWYTSPAMQKEYMAADAVYNALSALTTVGFGTAGLDGVPDSYLALLVVLSMIGGSAFSTAGGIKILRLLIALKVIEMEAKLLIMPRGYVPRKRIGHLKLDEPIMRRALAVIAAFMVAYSILVLLAFLLYSERYDPMDLIFEVTSALANIGLSTGVTSPEAPLGLKLILMVGMILGRLEVVPFIVAAVYLARFVRP
ncbi:MAG: TrkH family potassium uptake protein [Desulfurococcales archaeon]|nr:TrkH family potassium uptake protein [Desulfurococcales archaeon]